MPTASTGGSGCVYPPQAAALGPVLEGKSVVLSCPTASGKSLVAYAAIATAVLKGGRCLYIVPLRALAGEKYRDLQAFESLGIKVGITMGAW
ncbi:MAG: DEAD/DEAH box helicase, partial [Candidatus Thermoplasmatota archaeon]|nr:DEAD/DEAH box helicase [Candidatus Thermoplasmatota archaeon]